MVSRFSSALIGGWLSASIFKIIPTIITILTTTIIIIKLIIIVNNS